MNDGTWLALGTVAALAGVSAVRGSRAQLPAKLHKMGTLGDVNPIDHGGGVVLGTYKTLANPKAEGSFVEYVETPFYEDDDDDPQRVVEVYRVSLDGNPMELYDWVDWSDIAAFADQPIEELQRLSRSSDPSARAYVVESLASYGGWRALDDRPLKLTVAELEER